MHATGTPSAITAARSRVTTGESVERSLVPAVALEPWIADVRVMSVAASPERVMTRLPSGTTSLVLCARPGRVAELVVAGPNLHASYKRASSVPLYARFTFRPGAARSFFDLAVHELAGRIVPIGDLWRDGVDALHGGLARSDGTFDDVVRILEAALVARLHAYRVDVSRSLLAGRAVRAIDAGALDRGSMRALAAQLGVSERHLRQVFLEAMGIPPKRYARIARIRRVVARAGTASWAQLAIEMGFYDQAHLHAEFSELLGITPRAFLTTLAAKAQLLKGSRTVGSDGEESR
ncbi:helix-turn-helix domain-containing protein [Pendulispora albinea]|uniref:AraC family transcriptional regulator n=1 Tax=Pendulispora albinea TaxID=2741071 RepID=A0ABZ2LX97_9BACT